ncbi:uncharacterized protein [Typha latifolia]|uniref:uncharacterized protein n=1 Tax=Typha latifolia TaxID=4733 RepID=UPI003C2F8AB6
MDRGVVKYLDPDMDTASPPPSPLHRGVNKLPLLRSSLLELDITKLRLLRSSLLDLSATKLCFSPSSSSLSPSEGEEEHDEEEEEMMAFVALERWDMLGLGQATILEEFHTSSHSFVDASKDG